MRSMNPLCAPRDRSSPRTMQIYATVHWLPRRTAEWKEALSATSKAIVRGQLLYYYTCRISHHLPMCRYRVRVPMIARTRHKSCLSRRLSFNGRALYAAEQGNIFLKPLQFSAPRRLEIAQRAAA